MNTQETVPPDNNIFILFSIVPNYKPYVVMGGGHTAPERCQPEKFATPSFSAFLVVCDQDKKLQVGQQIL